jgi:hypothetical protein
MTVEQEKRNKDSLMNEQKMTCLHMFVSLLVLYYSSTQFINSINHRTTFALFLHLVFVVCELLSFL